MHSLRRRYLGSPARMMRLHRPLWSLQAGRRQSARPVYAVTDTVAIQVQGCTAAVLRSPLLRSPDSPSFQSSLFRVRARL